MRVIQVPMLVSDEVYLKMMAGEAIRYGGVVRDSAGHIIEHLKDAPIEKSVKKITQKAVRSIKSVDGLVIGGIALGVVTLVGGTIAVIKYVKNQKQTVPQYIADFNSSLKEYVESAKESKLCIEKINSLIAAIDALEKESNEGNITVDLSTGDLKTIMETICEYTERLAEANSYGKVSELRDAEYKDNITKLHRHLEVQREIFQIA